MVSCGGIWSQTVNIVTLGFYFIGIFTKKKNKTLLSGHETWFNNYLYHINTYIIHTSGFGGLVVACWPLVPKFEGSNPAEAVGFFRAKKSSAHLPSEGK